MDEAQSETPNETLEAADARTEVRLDDRLNGFDVTDFSGPFETFTLPDGASFPWYVLRFDKAGALVSPEALEHLQRDLRSGAFTDVFLFSHGWNNDWPAAQKRYRDFITNMVAMRQARPSPHGLSIRPLLIGVVWPSTSWMMPWEKGPRFAGGTEGSLLDGDAALETARRLLGGASFELADAEATEPFLAEDLVASWRALEQEFGVDGEGESPVFSSGGFVDGDAGPTGPAPARPAADLGKLDPRGVLRAFTVWKMKDRAGTVGGRGVARVLEAVRRCCDAHLHLVGHSFGAKVVSEAVAAADWPDSAEPPVRSLFLLQPAMSAWCFAAEPVVGGYRKVLDRVGLPILSTFSRQDVPLRRVFHLALRRKRDFAEVQAADRVPKWAALGGFGPQGLGDAVRELEIPLPGTVLDLDGEARVLALQGHERITGHGDVVNELTAWALWSLVDHGRV